MQEMRFIHYPLEHNLKVINFMTALKANLSESETKQIEKLFQTVNSDNEQICKLKAQIFENEREIKSKLEQI